jgi:diaminohydroxyphosphoribosylaminopyrimidine deaminase/5-amino-6-(5-phosphoribosylamino)uracil reductase
MNPGNKYSKINYRWLKSYELERPYVSAKIAISIDGKVNNSSNKSFRLTSKEAELEVHEIRNGNDAVISGANSVLIDNSKLTVRYPKKLKKEMQPIRYIIGESKIPSSFNIFKEDAETILLPRLNPRLILEEMWKNDIRTALLETGPRLLSKFLESNFVDELIIYMAPVILGRGDDFLMENIPGLKDQNWRIANVGLVGRDLRLHLLIN